MKDVSQLAGVSPSTVSRVLNGTSTLVPITSETRQRVLRAAEVLKYSPHPLARGLRGAGTALLGLIVREITDPFFTAMLDAIAQEAQRRGYNLVLGHARSTIAKPSCWSAICWTSRDWLRSCRAPSWPSWRCARGGVHRVCVR